MKTVLRLVLWLVLILIVIAGAGVGYLFAAFPKASTPSAIKIASTPQLVARGDYLTLHVVGCVECHSEQDQDKFALPVKAGTFGKGGEVFDERNHLPGAIYAKNITPAAIGSWTDGELLRAMTEGVSKDGTALFPIMPYTHFGKMDEEDPTPSSRTSNAEGDREPDPARRLNFPMNIITRTIPTGLFTKRPPPSDKVAYGSYMVNASSRSECHAPIDGRASRFRDGFRRRTGVHDPQDGLSRELGNITPDADTASAR